MNDAPTRPVFLERSGYQRRRMADAAFLLPVFGALLLCAPLLWPSAPVDGTGEGTADAGSAISMSGAMLYMFGVWLFLILGAALFGLRVRQWGEDPQDPGDR